MKNFLLLTTCLLSFTHMSYAMIEDPLDDGNGRAAAAAAPTRSPAVKLASAATTSAAALAGDAEDNPLLNLAVSSPETAAALVPQTLALEEAGVNPLSPPIKKRRERAVFAALSPDPVTMLATLISIISTYDVWEIVPPTLTITLDHIHRDNNTFSMRKVVDYHKINVQFHFPNQQGLVWVRRVPKGEEFKKFGAFGADLLPQQTIVASIHSLNAPKAHDDGALVVHYDLGQGWVGDLVLDYYMPDYQFSRGTFNPMPPKKAGKASHAAADKKGRAKKK